MDITNLILLLFFLLLLLAACLSLPFSFAIGSDEAVVATVSNGQRSVHEQILVVRADGDAGDVDVQGIQPERVLLVHRGLRARELSSFKRARHVIGILLL